MLRHHQKGRDISGVVLLDKILGISSNKALQQVKRLFKAKKAGHTGSLDPLATGILPICLGQATKLSQFLLQANKRYVATGQLGKQTTTADAEGQVINTQDYTHITRQSIETILSKFRGDIWQIPPMYSALKKDGQPLYKLARQGKTIKRAPRLITIYQLDLLDYQAGVFKVDVLCSKGTYIRTLIEDIAHALHNIAYVKTLRRTEFAHYAIGDSKTFNDLETNLLNLDDDILPIEAILPQYQSITLTDNQVQDIQYGRRIIYHIKMIENEEMMIKLLTPKGQFLAMAIYDNGVISPKRLLLRT